MEKFNPEVARQFGELFRRAREEKELSLEKAAAATFVSERFLRALEEGRWEELPGKTYALGYIKIYARFLGLDQEEVLASCRRAYEERDKRHEGDRQLSEIFPGRPRRRRKRMLLVFLSLLVALCGVFLVLLFSLPSPSSLDKNPSLSKKEPPILESSPSPESTRPIATIMLQLEAEEIAWVDVSSMGITMFSGILIPGKTYIFRSEGSLEVSGDSGNKIRVWLNGEERGYLAQSSGPFQEVFAP